MSLLYYFKKHCLYIVSWDKNVWHTELTRSVHVGNTGSILDFCFVLNTQICY